MRIKKLESLQPGIYFSDLQLAARLIRVYIFLFFDHFIVVIKLAKFLPNTYTNQVIRIPRVRKLLNHLRIEGFL